MRTSGKMRPIRRIVDPTDPVVFECKRKQAYPLRSMAETQARVQSLRSKEPLDVYRCPHCEKYHIGHPKLVETIIETTPTVVVKASGIARKEIPVPSPKENVQLIDTTDLAKLVDDFRCFYIFHMPTEMPHTEKNILEHGVLIAMKKGDDFYRDPDGGRSPLEKWRAYHTMRSIYVRNAVDFAKQIQPHLDRWTKAAEEANPPAAPLNPVIKKPIKLDVPAKLYDKEETFKDRKVWRDADGKAYFKNSLACAECGNLILLKARISEVNGKFTTAQNFKPTEDKEARPKAHRSREWVCGCCARGETPKKEAAVIEEKVAEPAKKTVKVKEEPSAKRSVTLGKSKALTVPHLSMAEIAFVSELEGMVLDASVPSDRVRGMAYMATKALQAWCVR